MESTICKDGAWRQQFYAVFAQLSPWNSSWPWENVFHHWSHRSSSVSSSGGCKTRPKWASSEALSGKSFLDQIWLESMTSVLDMFLVNCWRRWHTLRPHSWLVVVANEGRFHTVEQMSLPSVTVHLARPLSSPQASPCCETSPGPIPELTPSVWTGQGHLESCPRVYV